MRVRVTMVAVSIVLLTTVGCRPPDPVEPKKPDWPNESDEQGTGAASEANGENLFTSAEIAELCVRVAGCRISENSSKYRNAELNDPPNLYVVVRRGGTHLITSPSKSGWSVTFPQSPEFEFDVRSDNTAYRFEVYDAQWGTDPQVAVISPVAGKEIIQRVFPKGQDVQQAKQVDMRQSQSGVTIILEYVGIVRWYRLANIMFPLDSPSRKAFNGIPQLQVRMYRDGKELPSWTGQKGSVRLRPGWEGTFPKDGHHCWKILERSGARYDVAVWDLAWRNKQIFTRSDLPGEEFQNPITERVGEFVGLERASKVHFERLSRPIEQ